MRTVELFIRMKPATTLEEQLNILKGRSLIVDNDNEVLEFLRYNNYYRFTGYAKCFCTSPDCFGYKVSFKEIYDAYVFDSKVRLLLNKYIEKIEIYYKTLIAYYLSNKYSPLFYKDYSNYNCSETIFTDFLDKINNDIQNMSSSEKFIDHFTDGLPAWALVELLSFGSMSKLYAFLKDDCFSELCHSLKRIDISRLRKSLHSLTVIRNICSHRGRLFNKGLTNAPKLTKNTMYILNDLHNPQDNNRSVFIYCCCLLELLNNFNDGEEFISDLSQLIEDRPNSVNIYKNYGFINEWQLALNQINYDNKQP